MFDVVYGGVTVSSVPPQFHMVVGQLAEGLYSLKFHYCQNRVPGFAKLPYSFSVSLVFAFVQSMLMCVHVLTWTRPPQVDVIEKNPAGYLSAAEIPLSRLYIGMAGVFFTAAMVWVYTLMKHRYTDMKAFSHGEKNIKPPLFSSISYYAMK